MSETGAHSLVDLHALKQPLSSFTRPLFYSRLGLFGFFCLFFLAFGEFYMSPVLRRIALETFDGK